MSLSPARASIHEKGSITRGLRDAMGGVWDWVATQPDAAVERGPEGRWSMGQHLDHLIRSVQPINQGMAMPHFVLRMVFGTVDRPGMTYADLAAKYETVLDQGGKASGRYLPPVVPMAKKTALIEAHRRACETLCTRLNGWSEADLDRHGAKHPLIGMLTLREILFFTIHHHDHHLETLRRDYAG